MNVPSRVSRPRISLAAALIAFVCFVPATLRAQDRGEPPAIDWSYEAPGPGDPFEHAPLVPLRLSEERPPEIRETVEYRGERRLYGFLRFGSAGSKRVLIVLDELGGREFDLYVDANRDWVVEGRDLVPGTGPWRRAALKAEITRENDVVEYEPRQVVFRRSLTGRILGCATRGCLTADVRVGDRTLPVRRVDGDANGLFADARDRLWIDLDEDGAWDAFSEQFPFSPLLTLGGQRYAVRSDAVGRRLSFTEVVGSGAVRLRVENLAPGARVADLEAMLIGQDGSAFALRGEADAVSLPPGRYAFGTVSVQIEDPGTKTPWTFVFSGSGASRGDRWHTVRDGAELVLDPIGDLRFTVELPEGAARAGPGEDLSIDPRLYTADGLLINSCETGPQGSAVQSSDGATIRLVDSRGRALAESRSGFA